MKNTSIIIPTYKRIDYLVEILNYFLHPENSIYLKEILICDSENSIELQQALAEIQVQARGIFELQHLIIPNNISIKRNAGILHSSSDFLIFLDDDCIPMGNFIEQHIQVLKLRKNCITNGKIFFDPDQILNSNDIRYRNHRHQLFNVEKELSFKEIVTMNMGVSRATLDAHGLLFDESFIGYGMEDNDFGYRAEQLGVHLITSEASITHQDHHTFDSFQKKIFHTARDGITKFKEKSPEAVWEMKYSPYLESDYPHDSNFLKLKAAILRKLLFGNIANVIALILIKFDSYAWLHSSLLYRYVLAVRYYAGTRDRVNRYSSITETQNSWFQ